MGIFKTPEMPPPPQPPPEDPRLKQWEKEEEERLERIRRGQFGRRSTILTGGLGAFGEPAIRRKTLLGE